MNRPRALLCAAGLSLLAALPPRAGNAAGVPRIEARSEDLLAVGIVNGDRMSIHVSRLIDNAPVRDAALAVMLRGVVHPTVAESDGGYTLQTKDLEIPGSASMEFQIVRGPVREELKAELVVAAPDSKPEDKNGARQLGWWVLNFAVCIGFLVLLSRRRKAKHQRGNASQD